MKNPKSFCSAPWKSLFVDNRGDLGPCCLYVPQEDEKKYSISSSIEEYRNSTEVTKLKQQFLNNEQPKGCKVCFEHEKHGGYSFRMGQNSHYPELMETFEATGEVKDNSLEAFDIRLSNICNLKCNMCGPHASILILKDRLEDNPDYKNHQDYKDFSNITWVSDPKVWKNILDHSDKVRSIHLTGGEPLIIQEAFDFIHELKKRGPVNHITLSYNTNLTQFSSRVKEAWEGFQNILLYGSVDAVEELNNFIRFPSQWKKIQKNFQSMSEFLKEKNYSPITFHATWQVYNVFQITDLISFSLENCRAENKFPDIFPLDGPEHYNVRFLPRDFKLQVIEHFQQFQKNYLETDQQYIFEGIQRLINILEEPHPLEGKYVDTLATWIEKDSKSRGIDLFSLEPRLKQLFT